jgi:Fungal N-terminal domain of STAND proteins
MADPLSVLASLLAVATAGVQSTQSLKAAVKRYKTRDATLRRLLDEIEDAENILCALKQLLEAGTSQPITDADNSMAVLLRGPIERSSKVCDEFKEAMEKFSRKSKTSFIDWTKMEFMRGDVNQFMDTVTGYKATISVGLGVLTM